MNQAVNKTVDPPIEKLAEHNSGADSGANSGALQFVALLVTNLGAPPFSFIAGALIVGASVGDVLGGPTANDEVSLTWKIVLSAGIAPLLILCVLRLVGVISSLDLKTAKERYVGFGLALLGALIAWFVLDVSSPSLFRRFVAAHVTATSLLFLLTLASVRHGWKASIHSAGVGCLAVVAYGCGALWAAFWVPPVVFLISWSRLYLSRHSATEVFVGLLLGAGVFLLLF